MGYIIYHNNKCSKSRQALEILRESKISPIIIDYIKYPLNRKELERLLGQLNLKASDIIRGKEKLIKEESIDFSDEEKAMVALLNYPKLMERPIVVYENKTAVVGRPPEKVSDFIKENIKAKKEETKKKKEEEKAKKKAEKEAKESEKAS
jgi:arsenate reductase